MATPFSKRQIFEELLTPAMIVSPAPDHFVNHPILANTNLFISTLVGEVTSADLQNHSASVISGGMFIKDLPPGVARFWRELWDHCFLAEETNLSSRLALAYWLLSRERELYAQSRQQWILPHANYVIEMFTTNLCFVRKMQTLRKANERGFLRDIERFLETTASVSSMKLVATCMRDTGLWTSHPDRLVDCIMKTSGYLFIEANVAFQVEGMLERCNTFLREVIMYAWGGLDLKIP